MDSIQLFLPRYRVDECLNEMRQCLEKGWTGLGYKTVEFERAWMEYTGLPQCHFVASATAGLHLAVKVLMDVDGWLPGDEVVTTPLTFVSTNHAIVYEGLRPVFADVDEYLCLDPRSVTERITERTRAVMFVGLGGNAGQLEEIAKICKQHGLRLILDAAHMAGTRLHERHVGGEADVTVFSFHSVKNLPTADGGMLCFNDLKLDELGRKLSWLGISEDTFARSEVPGKYKWRYDVDHLGFKYHGNSIMAALGLVGLRYLDEDNAQRRQISQWYDSLLEGKGVRSVPVASGCESSRHLYQVLVESRDEIMQRLNEQQIYPGVHYRDNREFKVYANDSHPCPKAADASRRLISLPLHVGLSFSDVSRVCAALEEAVCAVGTVSSA